LRPLTQAAFASRRSSSGSSFSASSLKTQPMSLSMNLRATSEKSSIASEASRSHFPCGFLVTGCSQFSDVQAFVCPEKKVYLSSLLLLSHGSEQADLQSVPYRLDHADNVPELDPCICRHVGVLRYLIHDRNSIRRSHSQAIF